MASSSYADRVLALRAARATGRVPADLIGWLLELAARDEYGDDEPIPRMTPAERLALSLSAEIDRWMTRRGLTHRTVSVSRRSLVRALKGQNLMLSTVADLADALACDVTIEFRPRGIRGAE